MRVRKQNSTCVCAQNLVRSQSYKSHAHAYRNNMHTCPNRRCSYVSTPCACARIYHIDISTINTQHTRAYQV